MNRGDAIAANRIWFNMSPADRQKLQRGEGIQAHASKEEIEKQIRQHQQEMNQTSGDSSAAGQPVTQPASGP